jgi:hypothetical protein
VTARGTPQKHPVLSELQKDVVSMHPAIHLTKTIDYATAEAIRRRLVRRCLDPLVRQRRMGKVGGHIACSSCRCGTYLFLTPLIAGTVLSSSRGVPTRAFFWPLALFELNTDEERSCVDAAAAASRGACSLEKQSVAASREIDAV